MVSTPHETMQPTQNHQQPTPVPQLANTSFEGGGVPVNDMTAQQAWLMHTANSVQNPTGHHGTSFADDQHAQANVDVPFQPETVPLVPDTQVTAGAMSGLGDGLMHAAGQAFDQMPMEHDNSQSQSLEEHHAEQVNANHQQSLPAERWSSDAVAAEAEGAAADAGAAATAPAVGAGGDLKASPKKRSRPKRSK